MFRLLLGLIDPFTRIMNALTDARVKLANAETENERIAAQERVAILEQRQRVLTAQTGSMFDKLIRFGFAFPFVVYVNKCVIWDKVMGAGITDPLSQSLEYVMLVSLGFYFLHWTVDRYRK